MEENNLISIPVQIYNVDMTGMTLDHRTLHVGNLKGQGKGRCHTSETRVILQQLEVAAPLNRIQLPSFLIFDSES